MRVISGTARGRKLLSLEGLDTRPTTDRVKESIFNIVMPYLRDAVVLDLFAGSGALGIEALSRGALHSTFVESGRPAMEIVRQNLINTKLFDKATLAEGDAVSFLKKTTAQYSLIFMDPPYDGGFYAPVLSCIAERGILKDDGVLVLEKRADLSISVPEPMEIIKDRQYGKTSIMILGRREGR